MHPLLPNAPPDQQPQKVERHACMHRQEAHEVERCACMPQGSDGCDGGAGLQDERSLAQKAHGCECWGKAFTRRPSRGDCRCMAFARRQSDCWASPSSLSRQMGRGWCMPSLFSRQAYVAVSHIEMPLAEGHGELPEEQLRDGQVCEGHIVSHVPSSMGPHDPTEGAILPGAATHLPLRAPHTQVACRV